MATSASSALQTVTTKFADGVDEADGSGFHQSGSTSFDVGAAFRNFSSSSPSAPLFYDDASFLANQTNHTAMFTSAAVATVMSDAAVAILDAVGNNNVTADAGGIVDIFADLHLRHTLPVTIILSFLAGIISITTVMGNILVLVAFIVDRTLRQPGNYLIVSLALADLLIGIFSMPLYTMYLLLDESWPLGWIACDLWLSLDYTVCLVSQYTVFYITLDRFLVVKFTATYRLWLTTKRAKLIVAGIWVGSWLLFFPSITGWQFFVGERTVPPNNCYAQFMENPLFNTILVILYYWVTLFVISILYTFIYRKAWEMESRRKAEHKRAQMVHMKLAQAAIGRLPTTSSSNPVSPATAAKRNQPVRSGGNRSPDTSDDEKSTTSSQSWANRRDAGENAPNIKALTTSASMTGLPIGVPPAPPNPTPVKGVGANNKRHKHDHELSHKFVHGEPVSTNTTTTTNLDAPLIKNKNANASQRHKLSIFKRKRKAAAAQVTPEHEPFVRARSSPPSNERLAVVMTADESRSSPSKDDMAVAEAAQVVPMRRSYSDLEPVLSVGGLLRVPVDELIGIEFIDDEDQLGNGLNYPPRSPGSPFSGNTIYRLRMDPSLSKKSATFENLPSARAEKTIKKRINRLLERTRQGVTYGFHLTGSLIRNHRRHQHRLHRRSDNPSSGIEDNTDSVNANSGHKLVDGNCTGTPGNSLKKHRPGSRKPFAGLNRGKQNNPANSNNVKSAPNYRSRAHKALRMISFILGVFVITWTPYHILAIMKGFCNECVNDTLYAISYWFCYLNSPINPICYAVANKHFKRAFMKILHGNFKRV